MMDLLYPFLGPSRVDLGEKALRKKLVALRVH